MPSYEDRNAGSARNRILDKQDVISLGLDQLQLFLRTDVPS